MRLEQKDPAVFQSQLCKLSYSFERRVERCAECYLALWNSLMSRTRGTSRYPPTADVDMDTIARLYTDILFARARVKAQWACINRLPSNIEGAASLYAHFSQAVEGNPAKAHRLFLRSSEKKREMVEAESDCRMAEEDAGFMRVSAEIVPCK